MSFTLSGNAAFKTAFDGVLSKKPDSFVKLDENGRLKKGYSTFAGKLKFRALSGARQSGAVASTAKAIATAIASHASQEFAKNIPENLRDEHNFPKLADFEKSTRNEVQGLLMKGKKPDEGGLSRITVQDLRKAVDSAEARLSEKVDAAQKEALPRAAKTQAAKEEALLQQIDPEAASLAEHASSALRRHVSTDNRFAAASRHPEFEIRLEALISNFEKHVHSELVSFLSSRAAGKTELSDRDWTDAHRLTNALVAEKIQPRKAAQAAPPAALQPVKVQPVASPKVQPSISPKVQASQVPAMAAKKADGAVEQFLAQSKTGASFKAAQARDRIANDLRAQVTQITTDALLADNGGDLDAAITKAVDAAVAKFRAA